MTRNEWRRGARWVPLLLLYLLFSRGDSAHGASGGDVDPEAEGLSAAQRLEALVDRVEARRADLKSLRAEFRERKESPLLLEAEEAEGQFVFLPPQRARWDLAPPQDTVVVIDGDEMLTWYRGLGTAERVRLGSQGERLLQFFGPGSSLSQLRRYFDFRFTRSADVTIPFRLELLPRSRRVARRLRHLTLDIDRQLYLPVHVRFEEASGAVTEYWFSDMESNVEIPEGLFSLQLPPEVEVREVEVGSTGDRK